MSGFIYRGGALYAEDVSVADLAETVETPFYCYSTQMLRTSYTDFARAFAGLDATIIALACAAMILGCLVMTMPRFVPAPHPGKD